MDGEESLRTDLNATEVGLTICAIVLLLFIVSTCVSGYGKNRLSKSEERKRRKYIEERIILMTVAEKEKQKLESEERKSQSNMKTCEKAMPINEQKESNLDLPIGDDDGSSNDTEESEDSEQKCAICWEVFAENEKICWSRNPECSHAFHLDCIESWLLMHDRCPICRNRYLVSRAATPANAEGAPPSESSTPSRSIINPRTESANGDTIVNRLLETFRIKRSTRSERDDCLSSSRPGRSIVLSEGVVEESVVEEPEVISLPSLQPSVPIDIEKGSEQNIST